MSKAPPSPVSLIAILLEQRRALDREILAAVGAARKAGITWTDIAPPFGISRQAVTKKYGGGA